MGSCQETCLAKRRRPRSYHVYAVSLQCGEGGVSGHLDIHKNSQISCLVAKLMWHYYRQLSMRSSWLLSSAASCDRPFLKCGKMQFSKSMNFLDWSFSAYSKPFIVRCIALSNISMTRYQIGCRATSELPVQFLLGDKSPNLACHIFCAVVRTQCCS